MGKSAGLWITRSFKVLAIGVGGPLALLGGMAIAGLVVENTWARLAIALTAIIVVPAFVADRLLPENPDSGRGIVSDVLAVSWLGFAFIVFGVGIGQTQPLLDQEARRLEASNLDTLADATRWLAGGTPLLVASAEAAETEEATGETKEAPQAKKKTPKKKAPEVSKEPLTPEELFSRWAPSVVTVRISAGPFMQGGGTGFVIDAEGTVITNHHVVDGASTVAVKLKDGTWAEKVELLHSDKERDVAILRIAGAADAAPTQLGDSDEVKVGERVISIGNPLGLEHTLTDGLVSSRRKYEGKKFIQSTAPISPGNSGGPLFNLRGEVIGVTTASMQDWRGAAQNLNLAIPINEVKAMLKSDYPDAKDIGGGAPGRGTW